MAKAAASGLSTEPCGIRTSVSRAINSNNPTPPGANGMDEPMLVIAVTKIVAENIEIMSSKYRLRSRLRATNKNKKVSQIQIGIESSSNLTIIEKLLRDSNPSKIFPEKSTNVGRDFLGINLVNAYNDFSAFFRNNAINSNAPNKTQNGATNIKTKKCTGIFARDDRP